MGACPAKGWYPALTDEKEASIHTCTKYWEEDCPVQKETVQLESFPDCNEVGVSKGNKEISVFEHCKCG